MVNDIIEELLEPKLESLWWTSTHQVEETNTLSVGNRGLAWDLPFKDVFQVLGCRFHRDGKGSQGEDRTLCKGNASCWRDRYICRSKSVTTQMKCRRVLSHVHSSAPNGSVHWPWSVAMLVRYVHWEAKILRLTCRAKMYAGGSWIGCKKRASLSLRRKWRKMGLPTMAETLWTKFWTTVKMWLSMMERFLWWGLFVLFWVAEPLHGSGTGAGGA